MGTGRVEPPTGSGMDDGHDSPLALDGDGGFFHCAGDRKERILEALGDRWAREILLMLSDGPRSAQAIQGTNRMPQSTLYRKLHELAEIGLIGVQRSVISPDGKRIELYRSLLEELTVEMRGTRLRIDVRFRDLSAERLKEMWRSVRERAGRA
jgi:DNA-binding HxlR family transcriptional regulator